MYFVINDLSKINNMYRFSLASFLQLFRRALEKSKVSANFGSLVNKDRKQSPLQLKLAYLLSKEHKYLLSALDRPSPQSPPTQKQEVF